MAQSLSSVLVHLIFSTKERYPFIKAPVADELHAYLATVRATCGCPARRVGGTDDHVHILFSLSRTMAVSDLVEEVKKSSSKWIKTKGPELRAFAWQNGYGAFSIGQPRAAAVVRYIANQAEHHKTRTFQDEFRLFLHRYEVQYDERYVWD